MRTLPADKTQRLGAEAVDFDPEHVDGGDFAQYLEVAFGLGVEVEVEQQVHVGPGSLTHSLKVQAQVLEHTPVDVELGIEGASKAGPPTLWIFAIPFVEENIGLQRAEAFFAHFPADCLDAVELGDRGRVV